MYLLIAFSLIIASGFLGAFIWAVRNGQFDDRDTPSMRMLVDDVVPRKKKKKTRRVDGHGDNTEGTDANPPDARTAESVKAAQEPGRSAKPIHPKEHKADPDSTQQGLF